VEEQMTVQEMVCLEDQVHEALGLSPYLTRCRGVRCEAANGRVIIRGEVGSYFQKQMATEALRKLRGIDQIDNRLEVNWSTDD
jgi:osmotically-inducible protein OsmY